MEEEGFLVVAVAAVASEVGSSFSLSDGPIRFAFLTTSSPNQESRDR